MQTWDGESTLAWALAQRGECEEAVARSEQALKNIVRLQGVPGRNALDIREYHARVLRRCGRGAEAEPHFMLVWESLRAEQAKHHLAAKTAARLAGLLLEPDRPAEALEPAQWVLDWALSLEKPDPDSIANYRLLCAKALIGVDRNQAAREALDLCIGYLHKSTQAEDPRLLEARELLRGLP